ncbi:MAG: hypothetical protein WBE29_21285, partial [Pseudolabrys sp.]
AVTQETPPSATEEELDAEEQEFRALRGIFENGLAAMPVAVRWDFRPKANAQAVMKSRRHSASDFALECDRPRPKLLTPIVVASRSRSMKQHPGAALSPTSPTPL